MKVFCCEEREKIVRAAERYLSWGVEYKIPKSETKGEKKIYEKVREKWGIENEGEETRENKISTFNVETIEMTYRFKRMVTL